jgi:nicotinate-nucleotide pyrophosphorylase (carboxylating)
LVTPIVLAEIVDRALAEDLSSGDVTTRTTVPDGHRSIADLVARTACVFAGGDVFRKVFERVDPAVVVRDLAQDGTRLAEGARAGTVEGPTRALLGGERTALNFVQRLSGVATLTARFVAEVPAGAKTRIADTRKTTPGLRALEREAVRAGGGTNHRDDLGGGVLIKDNHVVAVGSVGEAIRLARAGAPHGLRIEAEVTSIPMLEEALAAGADAILVDNMDDVAVREAARRARGRALVEVSGGITLERVRTLAEAGVDVISVGALTHSAPALDLSMLVEAAG